MCELPRQDRYMSIQNMAVAPGCSGPPPDAPLTNRSIVLTAVLAKSDP